VKWAARFCDFGWMHALADQATVQEYEPGVGISDHIDDSLCFGPEIVTVSLLSPCVYRLTNPKTKFFVEQVIQPRSAVILSDQVRAHWKHGIPARKTDIVDGQRRRRTKRLSITFRTANPARVES
jgi:alkylated DNA repair dioxygenase AlkB